MKSISGSCLCKLIKFKIYNECRKVVLCHCTMCQKSNAEFSAYTKVKMDNFSLVKKKTLKWFKSSKNFERGFCTNCGSSLFFKKINNKKEISVSSGSLNKNIPIIGHIYYKNKKLMDRFVRESAGAINSTFVEKGVTPGMIFDKLREDDFYLKYLFADFLSYLLKRHGFEKFNITMKRLFYLKDKRAFNSGPMHCFVDVYSPTIFWEWWSIIEKKEGRYPARGSYRKIFQIQTRKI